MKNRSILTCLFSLVAALPLSAQTPPTGSGFSTSDYWTPTDMPMFTVGGGSTNFNSSRLNYIVSSPGAPKDSAGRGWMASVGLFNTDWSVQVDVNLAALSLSTSGQYANLNLSIMNGDNMASVAIDRYYDSGTVYGFEAFLKQGGSDPDGVVSTTSAATTGTLKFTYTAASNGTLTASIVSPTVNDGFSKDLYTLSNVTTTWTNVSSNPFQFALIGGSAGTILSSGEAFFDNFESTGLTASPIPEPSTYAALAGLAALGFVAWRRRKVTAQ
ncbi:MAG: PEP-CTERM sorting domain-containing protein [Opitutaceae bacterium]|nr:PEP-CTERM sorting domain-containing protein [Opitutaceae bacterium]